MYFFFKLKKFHFITFFFNFFRQIRFIKPWILFRVPCKFDPEVSIPVATISPSFYLFVRANNLYSFTNPPPFEFWTLSNLWYLLINGNRGSTMSKYKIEINKVWLQFYLILAANKNQPFYLNSKLKIIWNLNSFVKF